MPHSEITIKLKRPSRVFYALVMLSRVVRLGP